MLTGHVQGTGVRRSWAERSSPFAQEMSIFHPAQLQTAPKEPGITTFVGGKTRHGLERLVAIQEQWSWKPSEEFVTPPAQVGLRCLSFPPRCRPRDAGCKRLHQPPCSLLLFSPHDSLHRAGQDVLNLLNPC